MKIRILEEEGAEYKEKNTKLRTHLQMVQQERTNTEALLLERQRECDAAHHRLCLAEREIGRTKQDLHELKIKRGEVHVRMGSLENNFRSFDLQYFHVHKQNEIFVRSNELNSIKSQMDYDQQLIEVYLDACEEDVRCRERLDALKMCDESRISKYDDLKANVKQQSQVIEEVKRMSNLVAEDVKNAEQAITNTNKEIFDRRNEYEKALKEAQIMDEEDLIKLDELIYKAQLFNQRLEQRISKLESDPLLSQEEFAMKNKQISSLQNDLDFRTKSCNSLVAMINQFMNDKRICKMRSEKLQIELEKVKTELVTAQLTLTNSAMALRKAESAWREMLVECNLNKHQVRRMEARLNLLRNAVMCEEVKQLHLDALEREAGVEIETKKQKILLEMRPTEARLAEARAELTMRLRRLDQIRGRHCGTVSIPASISTELGASFSCTMPAGLIFKEYVTKAQGVPVEEEKQLLETKLMAIQNQLTDHRKQRRKLRSDALTRLLRDFNRLVYHLYDRCLRTSPCATDELLSAEQALVDTLQFTRPPGFTARISATSRANPERPSIKGPTHQAQTARMGIETQSLTVVSIGDKVELAAVTERQRQDGQRQRTDTGIRPDSCNKGYEPRNRPK
ncbi:Coiled-coil domain-containing protein 39 [Fasciola hepatica]|uniref:Coiled-coil domain-containing protein 39 n=1 Tax=Fasciola hepatica TaxID=6192 RepID=A0A4E0R5Q3_FASHE|nr:Coiled-coil domain-containing protein 39 [Fasciola hepatica]